MSASACITNADLAADIGRTVTDLAVDPMGAYTRARCRRRRIRLSEDIFNSLKRATTEKGPTPADCDLLIYDTTVATNALIESKGAKTPTLTAEGMGDGVAIAYESRFELFSGAIRADDWARAARKHGTR